MQSLGYNIFNLPAVRLPGSTLADRPFAAEFIVGAFPWLVLTSTYFKSKKIKIFFGFIFVIVLSYFFLLRGRAGYIAFFLGLIFFITLYLKFFYTNHLPIQLIKYFFFIIIIISSAFIICLFELKGLPRKSFKKTILSIYEPNNPRIMYWKASVCMFLENPIWGIGTGNWSGIYPKNNSDNFNDSNILISNVNPHNDYLEILSENGIIAFFTYYLLVFIALLRLIKSSKHNLKFLFIASSLFCLLIASMFSFTKDRTASMILFYLTIGLSFSIPYAKNKHYYLIKSNYIKTFLFFIMLISAFYFYLRIINEKHLVAAIQQKNKGNYNQMLMELNKINKTIYPLDPNQMPVSYFMGVANHYLSNYEFALEYFNEALTLSPESPVIKNNIAAINYTLGYKEKTENILLMLRSNFPNYIEPQINLLVLYTKTKQKRKAKKLIKDIESLYIKYRYEEGYKQNKWQNFHSYKDHIESNNLFLKIKNYYSIVHEGDVFKYKNDNTVYLLENGEKRKFVDKNAYLNSGYIWDDIVIIPDTNIFPDGKPIENNIF